MIVAHHLGEQLHPALVAGGAAVAPAFLLLLRARLSRLARALRRGVWLLRRAPARRSLAADVE